MNALMKPELGGNLGIYELSEQDVLEVSGGHPAVLAAAAVVALGGAALDLGHKLGSMLYKALH